MKRYILILLCAAIVLSFAGCKIVKPGEEDTTKNKTETTTARSENTNIPEVAKGVYGALEKGLSTVSAKLQSLETGIPAGITEPGPFALAFNFEGDFNIPSLGSAYAGLLQGISLSGDIKTNGTDFDIGAEIGLDAAQGTLEVSAYFDDATGLYFTVPGYMSDTLNIPLEALGDLTGAEITVDTSALEQLDPALMTDFVSAFASLMDEYADSIFTYIPTSAYSEQQVSYTPSDSSTSITVTETTITLTPGDFNAVIKGIAGELSQDTVLFPAFVDALLNIIEAGSQMNGEEFDRASAEAEIYAGLNELATSADNNADFDTLEIMVYYTSEHFYELAINITSIYDDMIQLSLCMSPGTGLCEVYLELNPGSSNPSDMANLSLYAGIGGEETYQGLTPVTFIVSMDDGYTQFELEMYFDISSGASGNVFKGEIYFTGDDAVLELVFSSSTTQSASGMSFNFEISSLELYMGGAEMLSGTASLSGTYRQLTSAEAAGMAPNFSNIVDISSVDEDYMNNLLFGLMSNPVISTIMQIMMSVEQ